MFKRKDKRNEHERRHEAGMEQPVLGVRHTGGQRVGKNIGRRGYGRKMEDLVSVGDHAGRQRAARGSSGKDTRDAQEQKMYYAGNERLALGGELDVVGC